jgi:metallo-beta-lactamase family protein
MSGATLRFLGAAETVTGSKHLVTVGGKRVLLDCGLFQGMKDLRLRNWNDPRYEPEGVAAVVLSHAHLDHSGYLPVLVRRGFRGPIHCTAATASLLGVLLPDAAYLQEEQAEHANRKGYSKHRPALPLFTREDAQAALELVDPRFYGEAFEVAPGLAVQFRPAGHILGSATVECLVDGGRGVRLVFSGDLGRWDRPILHDPELIADADLVVAESTYGGRMHEQDPDEDLAAIVRQGAEDGHAIVIPAFAVGRTQELLWRLRQLEDQGRIPAIPVYMDSPMAIDVTELYLRHTEEHDLDMQALSDAGQHPLRPHHFELARSREESIALNSLRGPVIIISASGMATGGRILHHLKLRLPNRRTTVLLVGFHGQEWPVRATVRTLHGLSAHADHAELLRWLGGFRRPPSAAYLVHGEPTASLALSAAIRGELGWNVRPARDGETVPLTA